MQRRGVEIGPARPHESTGWVERHLVENGRILQRPEQRAVENRQEADPLLRTVAELHREREWPHDMERRDPVDGMGHECLPEWILFCNRIVVR